MSKLSDRIRPNSEAAPWVIEEVKQLEANEDLSQRRILELELENKRLRDGLKYYADRPDESTLLLISSNFKSNNHAKSLLATPPPALAEAYMRLRDAAKGVVDDLCCIPTSDVLEVPLAEIERLEKLESGEE